MGWRRVDAPRTAAGRGAQENTDHLAPQGTEDSRPGRVIGDTNKGNPHKPDRGTQRVVDDRFASGQSAGREAFFAPGSWLVDRRLFVFVNPAHARYVREIIMQGISGNVSLVPPATN